MSPGVGNADSTGDQTGMVLGCGARRTGVNRWRPLLIAALALVAVSSRARAQDRPNIILILTDDLGYGDVSSYSATALKTPNIDRLAREGLRFTDAHAAAATCTPSRYALLTGEYAFRRPGTNVLPGDAGLVIDVAKTTMASML